MRPKYYSNVDGSLGKQRHNYKQDARMHDNNYYRLLLRGGMQAGKLIYLRNYITLYIFIRSTQLTNLYIYILNHIL